MPLNYASIGKTVSPSTFVCPSCRFRNALSSFKSHKKTQSHFLTRRRLVQYRHAATVSSVTAVGLRGEQPLPFQQLHDSLISLKNEAAVYVNSSQLQLALVGLESKNPITRVAGTRPSTGI